MIQANAQIAQAEIPGYVVQIARRVLHSIEKYV